MPAESKKRSETAVKGAFSPEFLNRLDAVVAFSHLTKDVVMKVIDKALKEMAESLKEKKITLEVTSPAKDHLFEKGYDPQYGARPIARAIDEHLKKKLVDEILFGALTQGGKVQVDCKKGELLFKFSLATTET